MASILQEAPEPALTALLSGGSLGVRLVAKETVEALLMGDPPSWCREENKAAYLAYDSDGPADSGRWIAVDNRGGDAWTEEFVSPSVAVAWLKDELGTDEAHRKDGTPDSGYPR